VPPRSVVIPFGVPPESRGIGLGLAALVHAFARLEGEGVALAQLHARKADEPEAPASPMEAFVPPSAWKDLAGAGQAPPGVQLVLTGAFEPPSEGRGLIQLLVFDAKDGVTRGKVEAHVDGAAAGRTILAAFDELWSKVGGGDLGVVRDIEDLSWEALESVLLAERCALHDPVRGGPHDRLAAMVHLGRAVEDAPDARFPAGRLAALALDTASGNAKLADAALRALSRAVDDAPKRAELVEATAALEVRLGDPSAATVRLERFVAVSPERARAHALLSEARRARLDLDGALDAVHAGLALAPEDPTLLTERGTVLQTRGDLAGAEADWRRALAAWPLFPAAYSNLAALVVQRKDARAGEELVDRALVAPEAHPEVHRGALRIALALEPDGLARAARVAKAARALLEKVPGDPWATFVLARSMAQFGERTEAAEKLDSVERLAAGTALAAEAQRGAFTLREAQASLEVESLLRAVYHAPSEDLEALAARGRRLAAAHAVWPAHFALGLVERRRERWQAARAAFEAAIAASSGCTPAHLELVAVVIALGDVDAALAHAERAAELEGETSRTLAVRASALLASGRKGEAIAAIDRSLALDPSDEANRALRERIKAGSSGGPGPLARLRGALARFFK
jgi:tetratricopeptide (TPR) repeat protein